MINPQSLAYFMHLKRKTGLARLKRANPVFRVGEKEIIITLRTNAVGSGILQTHSRVLLCLKLFKEHF